MNRLIREIDFHEKRFADGVGARPQDRFYVAVARAYSLANELTEECVKTGGSGLEVGSATGTNMERLTRIHAFDAYGIDISPAAVDAAKRRFSGQPRAPSFSVMDANHLTYADGTFDFIFGLGVIHHLELPRAIEEARRVMKPGGRFVFVEPLGTNPLINWYRQSTPDDRSPDETPLTAAHLKSITANFPDIRLSFFGFSTIGAIPFARWPGLQSLLLRLGRAADRTLFTIPGAWRLAWMVVIDARAGSAAAK